MALSSPQENPHEIDILFKELLISVTNFFRDPEAFDVLAKTALPVLLRSCLAGEPVRNVECTRVNKAGQELKGTFTLIPLIDERDQPAAICMVGKHPGA